MQFHRILKIVFISIQKESIKHTASSNFKDSFYIISERKYVLLKPSVCASRYACRITKVTYLEKFFQGTYQFKYLFNSLRLNISRKTLL